MLWLVLATCAALLSRARADSAARLKLGSSVATAPSAPSNITSNPMPAGKLVENIRRQLMRDNYDYIYVESGEQEKSPTNTSATEGLLPKTMKVKRNRTVKTAVTATTTVSSIDPEHLTTLRHITFKGAKDNSSQSMLPMNEGKLRYQAFEETDKVQGVTAGKQQKKKKLSESRIDPLINDLLYYIDDKHLRRNNDLSDDTSDEKHHDNDDSVSDTDSGENNFFTTISMTSPKKINNRLYKGFRQRSKMYGVHGKHHNIPVDYRKGNRHGRKHKHPYYRHKDSRKRGQRNEQHRNDNFYDKMNHNNKELVDEQHVNINEQIKYTAYNNSITEAVYTTQENDQQDQEFNNKNQSHDDIQNDNQNETVYKDDGIEETRPNDNYSTQDNAVEHSQYDSSSDEHFYSKDDNKVNRRVGNNAITTSMAEQHHGNDVDNVETTASVKYKLLKIPSGVSGRRSGSGGQRVLQESGHTGVALWALGSAPLPQFRLPRARRQYMLEKTRLRPPLEDLLPVNHRRNVYN